MPIYRYKHTGENCKLGEVFELEESMRADSLEQCPKCQGAVRRVILQVGIATPTGDSELKSMGFTKLVRRDQGVYENVTATGNESRYMEAGKSETLPDLKRKISD